MANPVVAIDGPSASGKSTVAKAVAKDLGYLYVDSGALYRAVAWQALERNVAIGDEAAVVAMMDGSEMKFFSLDGAVRFSVDGVMPDRELRTPEVNAAVSTIASHPEVRHRVVGWLREMRSEGPLVVEGRDIGTVVFPDARHSFYLDASPEERSRRRHAELQSARHTFSVDDVKDSLSKRDQMDSTRKVDPLRVASGAKIVDSTGLTIDQVVDRVLEMCS